MKIHLSLDKRIVKVLILIFHKQLMTGTNIYKNKEKLLKINYKITQLIITKIFMT